MEDKLESKVYEVNDDTSSSGEHSEDPLRQVQFEASEEGEWEGEEGEFDQEGNIQK